MRRTDGGLLESSEAGKVCVAVFAGSWYRSYVPLFLFCLFKTYPDYEAVVFLRKPLGKVEKPGLAVIRGMGAYRLAHDAGLSVFPKSSDGGERVKLFQALRFLALTPQNVERYFAGYDYVYLTDVDVLIMPEKLPLAEQHLRHMQALGLPYSNFVRSTNQARLTGLHFAQRSFYQQVAPVVDRYAERVKKDGLDSIPNLGRCPDEALWLRIVRETGIGIPPKCPYSEKQTWEKVFNPSNWGQTWFGPHHGVHVGFGRAMHRFRDVFKLKFYQRYLASLEKLARGDDRFRILCGSLHTRARGALAQILAEAGTKV